MSFVTSVKKAVRDRLIARSGGIDFSRLDKVPESLSWPLQRHVMAPNARLTATREADPVQRLASLLGMDANVDQKVEGMARFAADVIEPLRATTG